MLLSFIYFSPLLKQICLRKSKYIIDEICRNSHFRALKMLNFFRPPTIVANIFLYHISPPTFEMATPCLSDPFHIIAMIPRETLMLCCVHIAQLMTHPAIHTLPLTLQLCYKLLSILQRMDN